MLKKSSRYEQGNIVILELPFTDLLGSKLRPVLVLNAIDLGDDIIVAKITSSPGRHRVPIMQTDLAIGRLRKEPSYIDCSSIFTVEKKLVIKVVSRLTTKALDEVKGELKRVLGLK
ncbi:MAG: type II toxin-antitoxin system PemK/MazF family toxin [Desulfurococcales archaeon]|nr:type II toxin-antitoxin system PemK/MazF family toxin [Desulfurococcales archaeon]